MIHRQESFAFLGVPFARYIDIEDSEAVLRAVRLTPPDMPIGQYIPQPYRREPPAAPAGGGPGPADDIGRETSCR